METILKDDQLEEIGRRVSRACDISEVEGPKRRLNKWGLSSKMISSKKIGRKGPRASEVEGPKHRLDKMGTLLKDDAHATLRNSRHQESG